MISELYIEGQPTDITTAMSSLMTFAIDDIKDFAARSTAFSKTIVLPGSLRNNILFGNIFEVSVSNDYDPDLPNINVNFNASALAKCLYFQDFIQVFKGTIRVLQINVDRGRIEYEVAISGELTKLNSLLTTALLEELDFSAYDLVYNETNVVASWDNPGGSGVYFPLIDYGTYSANKHDWDILTFRPALYVKEYIDKIFEGANFRYESDLFNTSRFKSLVIPHNQKSLSAPVTNVFIGSIVSNQQILNSGSGLSGKPFFDSWSGSSFTSIHSPTDDEFEYNQPNTISTNITYNFSGFYVSDGSMTIMIQQNKTPGGIILATKTFPASPSGFWSFTGVAPATFDTNDTFYILAFPSGAVTYTMNITSGALSVDTISAVPVPIIYGDTIPINSTIPKNIKQIDFLVSIVKLFNLYIVEDRFDERLLHITPYVDYYSVESQNAVDWTYKLDRNSPINIKPLSEINTKIYNFKYQEDGDYYNDLYKKRYNLTYGSYIFDTAFEFIDNTTDVEIIFASTPLVGYAGEEKVYPTIFKLTDGTEETIDSVIRIMQTKKVTGVTSWDLKDGVTVLSSLTDYGYAGHFNDPDNVTDDLNFGAPQEVFFILVSADLSATQFNIYWSAYMAEITDKDSKLLMGKFYLTPKDILQLDFSKYVNVDGNLFRLNKIQDYNLTKPDLAKCELLKVINTIY